MKPGPAFAAFATIVLAEMLSSLLRRIATDDDHDDDDRNESRFGGVLR
jgi:hypothetical protein